jgi:hypothetical protein
MAMPEEPGNRECRCQTRGPAQNGNDQTSTDDVLVEDHANVEEVEEEIEAANVYSDRVAFATDELGVW